MKHFVLAYSLMLFATLSTQAQRACASHEYLQQQLAAQPLLAQKIALLDTHNASEIVLNGVGEEAAAGPAVIKIPVVVHVLYNNNVSTNINEAQVRSQIDALNKDYRRLNADTINTPVAFRKLAADCRIEFELAKIDPDGRATNGIVRKFTSITMFGLDDRIKYSGRGGHDAWDASSYLNIWVGPLAANLLGYASTLGCAKEIDGVVIASTSFGTTGSVVAPYNKGRTATHEIGHWLGLRHIWGDSYCGNDYIDDTPPQRGSTRNCPTGVVTTCDNNPSSGDMYNNYMDFTDDACLNLFTIGQRDKMRSLFNLNGARYPLLFSKGITGTPIEEPVKPVSDPEVLQPVVVRTWPNPAYNTITVDAGASVNVGRMISVHNHLGQQVMTATLTQQITELNIRSLGNGVYFIRFGGDRTAVKFVKAGN